MRIKNNFLYFLFIVSSFSLFIFVYGMFSSASTNAANTFTASAIFPTAIQTVTPTSVPTTNTPTPTLTPAIANYLVINEVLYDTSTPQNISGAGGSNRGEFVEIYNPSNSPVSLIGWTIEDNTSSETLTGTLNPGGRLILTGGSESEFEAIWTVPADTIYVQASGGTIGNGLANGGDNIVFKNGTTVIDKMSWGTDTTGFTSGCGSSCPTTPVGQSLERNPAGIDTDDTGNFTLRNPPTPGS